MSHRRKTNESSLALCHCGDCRKISGGSHSVNVVVPGDNFKSSGTKTYTKTADGGNKITSHFCGDCGSTLFREGDTFGTSKVVKAGVLDGKDAMEKAKPDAELYAPTRPSWQPKVESTTEMEGMPA